MKLSAFNVYVPDYPEPGATLVHNTFSGGFVVLDAPTIAALRKADLGAALEDGEAELIDEDYLDPDVGILVESRAEEERAYRAHHQAWRQSTRLDVICSTTFACNLDCSYCCQADVLDGQVMNAENGAHSAAWIANRAIEIGAKEIRIDFIGGEPLLQPARIQQIVDDIHARLSGRGIDLNFGLITNGYFLSRELVEKWIPLGLRRAKVTLDGDESTHAITRKSKKKGENSFQRIFDNIIAVCDLISVYVNGNYQPNTVHGFLPLIHKLSAAGFKKGSRMHFSPALEALGAPTEAASGSCMWAGSAPEYMVPFGDEMRRAGYQPTDISSVGPCAFHRVHSYSIDPDGRLFKCPGFLGKPEWAVGHVSTGLNERYHRLANANPQRLCGSCAHRPDCSGSCIAAAWIQAGRSEGVNCEIEFFKSETHFDIVKRKFELATHDTVEEALERFPRLQVKPVDPTKLVQRRNGSVGLRVVAA